MDEITIRKATLEDAEKLRELRLEIVKLNPKVFGVSYKTLKRIGIEETIKELQEPGSATFIAEDNRRLVGMIRIHATDKKGVAYVGRAGVLPAYQRQGTAKRLHHAWYDWVLKDTEYQKVQANTRKSNTAGLKLAKGDGFRIVGEGNYRGIPEWNLEMEVKR